MPKLSSNTQCQKQRLLDYLRENGRVTTLQARSELDILMPATRIFELKADGNNIITYRRHADTGLGSHTKIAEYVLLKS